MARTTDVLVKKVLAPGRDYDTVNNPSLQPFIEAASSVVDDVVTCATRKGKTLTSTKLELIERWLAAHLYQMSDEGYTSRSTMSASGSFQGQTGMYLEATMYGQTAITLDPTGCLVAIAKGARPTARAFWAGKRPSEQTDYDARD